MNVRRFGESPTEMFGLPFFHTNHALTRIPEEYRASLPKVNGRRTPGARMAFRTNAKKLTVRMTLASLSPDIAIARYGCQSATVIAGDRREGRLLGLVTPPDYSTLSAEKSFYLSGEWQDVTIWLPRNEPVTDLSAEIEDGAEFAPPTPYKYGPILYYGSSITEGGCCAIATNHYNAILSSRLDAEYYNYGFSGQARGEPEMAEFLSRIPAQVFVLDYDHNAPTAEHLAATHEPFFRIIRKNCPGLPVLMLTRPTYFGSADEDRRRAIVRATYEHSAAEGDRNVYFVDGKTFFGDTDRNLCTVDNCHPNDLGFWRMANVLEPVLRHILEKQ